MFAREKPRVRLPARSDSRNTEAETRADAEGALPGKISDPAKRALIDRTPQNLPLPLGGLRSFRQKRRPHAARKWWRRYSPGILTWIGLLAAVAGAYLSWTQQAVSVYITPEGSSIHIGNSVLTRQTDSLFVGDAAMVIVPIPAHGLTGTTTLATASTYSHNHNVAGWCNMTPSTGTTPSSETCRFWIGTPITSEPTFKSTDTFDTKTGHWTRRYTDGLTVEIAVPSGKGGIVPVPFPVGR